MLVVVISAPAQHRFSALLQSLILFQCQACVKLDINSHLWRDGMIVARAGRSFTQCLAVMVDPLRAVHFFVRGEEGSVCMSLLDAIMREWTDVVEKHSPGTDYSVSD